MNRRTLAALIAGSSLLFSLNSPGADARYGKAKENMATFKTAEGLTASLFAAEPMIQNPTNIDIDPRGRVWAVECVNYRKWMDLRPEGDRVVILEDTNGDGEADKEITFFQSKELTNPLGICVLPQPKGTKVIVSAAPNVWLLTDADGDDVAEDAKVIFKVGGVWNYDHQVHAFVFGPDGKFYFNSGNSITELLWPDGTRVKDLAGKEITGKGEPYRQGMVFRCDIDLATGKASNVETLGHNFRNNYEVAVDSFGTMWQSDNDDDGNKGVRINYVMEFGNYGFTDEMTGAGWSAKRTNMEPEIPLRHWHLNDPGVVPNLLQTGGGSPTGILVNENAALGPKFANQLIHCDAGPRVVRAYSVKPKGAGYTAEITDILTSSDQWYRPSDVALAPDGSLFVADWYDPGVGGHNMGDREPGKIMGRIYRVSAAGVKPPPTRTAGAAAAVADLCSPNHATRYQGYTQLYLNPDAEGVQAGLKALLKSSEPRLRARALGVLARIKPKETALLRIGLEDADENVRIAAVRLATTLERSGVIDTSPLDEDRALVGKLLRDTPAVRRQIALSLYRSHKIERLWAALAMQHDAKDRWYLEALGIGSIGNEDLCFDAWRAMVGENWNTPAGRDIVWRLRSPKSAPLLAKILQGTEVPDAEKPRFIRAFDFLPDGEERNQALLQLAKLGTQNETIALEALARLSKTKIASNPEVTAALDAVLGEAKGTPRFVELVNNFRLPGQGAALLEVALKDPTNPLASEAVRLAIAEPDGRKLLDEALAKPGGARLIDVLAGSSDRNAVAFLSELTQTATKDVSLRTAAVQALARNQQGVEALLKLAREQRFPSELKSTATAALTVVQFPKFKDEITQLFPNTDALAGTSLPPIAELAKEKGDPAHGKLVAERAESTCVTCHRIGNAGVDFAPALTEIGSKLGKDALFDSIINPNAGISQGFETWQIDLKGGGAAMGIVRSETAEELVLAMPMGTSTKIPKGSIAKREKLPNSMMPTGLAQVLGKTDLVDLVEYLATLKKP